MEVKQKVISMKGYLKPGDISPGKTEKIISRLNSFVSFEQLQEALQENTPEGILTTGDVQRILNHRTELGEFRDLRQLAVIQRIGAKKFDSIVRALSKQAFQASK